MMPLPKEIQQKVDEWLSGPFDEATKQEILKLQATDEQALIDAFYQDLSFGTGGLRGVMGVGTNRMNVYTVASATQGLANYLKKQIKGPCKVFIGYDTRHHSKEFAETTASVLAGNHIEVLLCDQFCPTPFVSFGCRHFKCTAAIMITASHNPPQYNGYKVYWNTGGQVVFPHDEGIVKEADQKPQIFKAPLPSPLVHPIKEELDDAYFQELAKTQQISPQTIAPLQVVYTNLHGTGIRAMERALHLWGIRSFSFVPEQKSTDPNFPAAPSPNPEEPKTLELGSRQLLKENKDILLASDPDADRLGVVIQRQGTIHAFTGHQIACLCLHHICTQRQLPKFPMFIASIVTTRLFRKIVESFHGTYFDVLTGFKYIAEKIENEKNHTFVFGAEESYGYLGVPFVRDKDAISSACLLVEAAALLKQQKKTLLDQFEEIDASYGIYCQGLINRKFPATKEGMDHMSQAMETLRKSPLKELAHIPVTSMKDYLKGLDGLPPSNVLEFFLEDQTRILFRPSGTEPKMKIYIETIGKAKESRSGCQKRLDSLIAALT